MLAASLSGAHRFKDGKRDGQPAGVAKKKGGKSNVSKESDSIALSLLRKESESKRAEESQLNGGEDGGQLSKPNFDWSSLRDRPHLRDSVVAEHCPAAEARLPCSGDPDTKARCAPMRTGEARNC